jgi:hypothetical protein
LFLLPTAILYYNISTKSDNISVSTPKQIVSELVEIDYTNKVSEPIKIDFTEKVLEIKAKIDDKKYILSSSNVGTYQISLYSYSQGVDTNQTESLFCILKLREEDLVFTLAISKIQIKYADELFISVTTDKVHTVIEDAYILKNIEGNIQYSLELILYDDYVDLALNKLGKKLKPNLIINPNIKNNLTRLSFPKDEGFPTELADTEKLIKPTQFKMLQK